MPKKEQEARLRELARKATSLESKAEYEVLEASLRMRIATAQTKIKEARATVSGSSGTSIREALRRVPIPARLLAVAVVLFIVLLSVLKACSG